MEPTRSMGQRLLLREGVLTKAKSGRSLRGFLCNDVFILTDASVKSLYRMVSNPTFDRVPYSLSRLQPIYLTDLVVSEVPGKRGELLKLVIMDGKLTALRRHGIPDTITLSTRRRKHQPSCNVGAGLPAVDENDRRCANTLHRDGAQTRTTTLRRQPIPFL
jgi:hypothetical protein